MSAVVDTTVLVDHLRGVAGAVDYLRGLSSRPAASEISRVEIIRGLRPKERAAARRLFLLFNWVPLTTDLSEAAGELGRRWRRSHTAIDTRDLVVAATAQAVNLPVATKNVKHFSDVPRSPRPLLNRRTQVLPTWPRPTSVRRLQSREHREVSDVQRRQLRTVELGRGGDDVVDDVDSWMGATKASQVFGRAPGNSIGHGYQRHRREQRGDLRTLMAAHSALDLDPREHAGESFLLGQRLDDASGRLVPAEVIDQNRGVKEGVQSPRPRRRSSAVCPLTSRSHSGQSG